jgi:predicted nucleic acid-binding protein
VEKHRPGALLPLIHWFAQIPDAEIVAQGVLEQIQRSHELHAGELAALALALQNPGAICLTDDSAARLAAQTLQLPVHGTIGILLRSLRRQQRTKEQVLTLLRELPSRSTLHIAPSLLASIVVEVEQV